MTTIKDISKIAEVSNATVSRALNNTGRMKIETRERILEIAEQLGYVPNYSARGLVTDKSYNIGIFSVKEKVISSTFYEIIEGIQEVIGFKYNLVFGKIKNDAELEELLKYKKYDAVIFISIIKEDVRFINLISEKVKNMVVINRKLDNDMYYNVTSDDYGGSYKAVEHLIKLDHKRIAHIEGPPENIVSTERKKGYLDALMKYNIPVNNEYIVKSKGSPDSGYIAAQILLNLENPPTAFFVYSDPVAIGVIKAISKEGYTIPDDIAIIGFDNMVTSQYLVPSLSSIDKQRVKMGNKAAEILLKLLNDEKPENKDVMLETRLIIRESCGGLSRHFI